MPTVSVVMPVFNCEAYVAEAIHSILDQTSPDWELIVIDDASKDHSVTVVESFKDPRVRLFQNHQNRGVAFSLNRGLQEARGEFIARMDADDISKPHRLATQVGFLREHPKVGICGSWVECFGQGRSFKITWPVGTDCVRSYMLFDTPLAHPAVCMRHSVLQESQLKYDEQLQAAQDYDLWCRLADWTQLDNISQVLLSYRLHRESVTHSRQGVSDRIATSIIQGQLKKYGLELCHEELNFHRQVGHGAGMRSWDELCKAECWLRRLLDYNRDEREREAVSGMVQACSFVWWRVCLNSVFLGPRVWWLYFRSPLAKGYSPQVAERLFFLVNGLLTIAGRGAGPTGRLPVWDEHRGD